MENRLTRHAALDKYGNQIIHSLQYDVLGRLASIYKLGGVVTTFLYDGDALIGEYVGSGGLVPDRRYVHGPGVDEPIAWYEGAERRFLHADHQGSVIGVTDAAGNIWHTKSYDEYGVPAASNMGRFGFTGQAWLPEVGLYHYKARAYSPTLGRFMQTDPVGYKGGMNLYAYVGDDPVNTVDPSGRIPLALPIIWGGRCALNAGCRTLVIGGVRAAAREVAKAASPLLNEAKPEVHPDKQGKHQPGHKTFDPDRGRSELTDPDPQALVDEGAGTGRQVGSTPVGEAGSKEVVDFGRKIGVHVDPSSGERQDTTTGTIHYDKNGKVHIVPAKPVE